MDCMFEAYLTHEAVNFEPDDIPQTKEPVWILGKKYNATQELDIIRRDIHSKLWFTYRKGFVPIGGPDGPTSDKGWGCMLRCGQMVLAQALVSLHLNRSWFWTQDTKDSTYLKILRRFEDRRQEPFSIHQIAQMGKSEGKEIGHWFGPNTISQVLKKLIKYDEWSSVAIHVALDNMIVIDEIKKLSKYNDETLTKNAAISIWKPLLLLIPLRLGLSEINPIYVNGLKKCFQIPQSLGVIGGKPNHALYFIGCVGEEVLYLDPHTTQRTCPIEDKTTDEQIDIDSTYHCKYASRMPIISMDPSIAVCFFCESEQEFDNLCDQIKQEVIPEKQPLFEICKEKPKQWIGYSEGSAGLQASSFSYDIDELGQELGNSDEEFEIL